MEYSTIEDELMHTLGSVMPYSPSPSTSASSESSESSEQSASPEPTSAEKKPVKKRKSWGQELPTPTTNLPPRKRAKTEAEKEQRRIERVLRNRAAAQSSRERKRKEVEALEDVKNNLADENQSLRDANIQLTHENIQLRDQVAAMMAETKRMRHEFDTVMQQFGMNVPEYHTPKSEGSPTVPLLLTPSSVSHDSFSVSSPPEITTPGPTDGTLDPSDLTTPVKSEEETFGLTQHSAVSTDWTLFEDPTDVIPFGDMDNMFALEGYPESSIGDNDLFCGEGQLASPAAGNSMNFQFESLVSFPDDDSALGV